MGDPGLDHLDSFVGAARGAHHPGSGSDRFAGYLVRCLDGVQLVEGVFDPFITGQQQGEVHAVVQVFGVGFGQFLTHGQHPFAPAVPGFVVHVLLDHPGVVWGVGHGGSQGVKRRVAAALPVLGPGEAQHRLHVVGPLIQSSAIRGGGRLGLVVLQTQITKLSPAFIEDRALFQSQFERREGLAQIAFGGGELAAKKMPSRQVEVAAGGVGDQGSGSVKVFGGDGTVQAHHYHAVVVGAQFEGLVKIELSLLGVSLTGVGGRLGQGHVQWRRVGPHGSVDPFTWVGRRFTCDHAPQTLDGHRIGPRGESVIQHGATVGLVGRHKTASQQPQVRRGISGKFAE